MDDRVTVVEFCEAILKIMAVPGHVSVTTAEKRELMSEAHLELKVVDGAMTTVGEPKFMGTSYELRFEVWKEDE